MKKKMINIASRTMEAWEAMAKAASMAYRVIGNLPCPSLESVILDLMERKLIHEIPTNEHARIFVFKDDSCLVIGPNEILTYQIASSIEDAHKRSESVMYE